MVQFEDVILWLAQPGATKARRNCWAKVTQYTQATPPINYERYWRIWMEKDCGGIVQGWGGQIGFDLDPGEKVRDGTYYTPSDQDRIADDWELLGGTGK